MKDNKFYIKLGSAFFFLFICALFFQIQKTVAQDVAIPTTDVVATVQEEAEAPPTDEELIFEVTDALTDTAKLKNGNVKMRIYQKPRLIYKSGDVLKVREKGWNLFNENESKLSKLKNGYSYPVNLGSNQVKISAGTLEYSSGKTKNSPATKSTKKFNRDGASMTELPNVYPNIDVKFKDVGWRREKTLIIKKKPAGLAPKDDLIFWETINIPAGASVYAGDAQLEAGKQDVSSKLISVKTSDGDKLMISPAFIFDATVITDSDFDMRAEPLNYLVDVDYEKHVLRLGVVVKTDYLLDSQRIFPVTIDPNYYACKEGYTDSYKITCSLIDGYFRQSISTPGVVTNQTTYSTQNTLFTGYSDDVVTGLATREIFLGFSLPTLPNYTVNNAWLYMKYKNFGYGSYTGSVGLSAKAVNLNQCIDFSSIYYSSISGSLSSMSAVSVSKMSLDTWYKWQVTSVVKSNNCTGEFYIVVEPTFPWSGSTFAGPPSLWPKRLSVFYSQEDTGNNGPYLEIDMTPKASPDLVINSMSLETANVIPGQTISVDVTVKNSGTATAGASQVGYYYSENSTCSTSDTLLGYDIVEILSPGITSNKDSENITIPMSATVGSTRYICFIADRNGVITESKEDNNTGYGIIYIKDPKPDLKVTGFTYYVKEAVRAPSETVTLTNIKVKNDSQTSAGSFKVGFYLSDDKIFSQASDVYLNKDYSITSLPAGDTNTKSSVTMTIPSNTSAGTKYILIVADYTNLISELDDTNNTDWHEILIVKDPLEPNNSSSQATNIGSATSYTNNNLYLTVGDNDWFKFSYNSKVYYFSVKENNNSTGQYGVAFSRSGSTVTIDTVSVNDSTTDTYLILWDTDADTILASDNNSGPGNFSHLTHNLNQPDYDFSASNASILTSGPINSNNTPLQVQVKIKNAGNKDANGVNYTLKLKSGDFALTNLSGLNIPANSDQYYTLTGYVQDSCSMSAEADYQVEINIDPNHFFDSSNNIITTSNSIHINRYSSCGGGGGDPPVNPPPDSDNDSFPDPVEKIAGTNITASDTKPIYDLVSKAYSASLNDLKTKNYKADPVNIRTGAFEFTQTDFSLRGRGLPINFTRTYNSKLTERNGRLGRGWSFSYNSYYYQDPTTKNVEIYHGGALISLFTTSDGGLTFTPPHGVYDSLTREGDVLIYKTLDGIRYVFSKTLTDNMAMLEKIVDTNGNATSLSYTYVRDLPLLTSVSDASGRQIELTYGPVDDDKMWDKITQLKEQVNLPNSRIVTYEYSPDGLDLAAAHENNFYQGNSETIDRKFTYDNGRMTEYEDPRGTILYNVYDADGRVTEQYEYNPNVDAVGQKHPIYKLEYNGADADAPGSTHCVTVKNYRDASNHYDETTCFNSDELRIYENKGGNIERWAYNAQGMPTQYTDQNNNAYNYEYDAKRRMTKETLPKTADWNSYTTYKYEDNFNRLIEKMEFTDSLSGPISPTPKTTVYTIDPTSGNITSIKDPMGFTESFTYDAYGNVWTRTDKNGKMSTFAYDAGGNYQTQQSIIVQDVDGASQDIVKKFEYDVYGNVKKYTDPRGLVYQYGYDTRNNLREETNAISGVKAYTYDKEGHRLTAADELGRVATYTYDKDINASLLKIEKMNGAENIAAQYQYDYLGNLKKEIDPLGREIIYTYNSANRVIKKQMPYNAIDYTYDGVGNVVSEVNSLGQKIDYGYDARGNQISIKRYLTDAEFVIQTKEFDGLSRVVKSTDGNGGETQYQYDNNNRLTKVIDPIGAETCYVYDNNGNKIEEINALNYSAHYQYDALNRLVKQTNALDKETKYYYDANSNLIKVIDRQDNNGANNNHVAEYVYDNLNRKTQEKDAYGAIVAFGYDAVGNLTGKTDQLNRIWTYGYDDLNRLTSEKDPANNATTHVYDKAGNELSVTYAGGKKTSFVYDDANRLTQTKDSLNNSRYYQYDVVGNKTKETDKLGRETKFVYDKLNRLTQETNAQNTVVNYTYDKNSNRLTENAAGKIKTFVYDVNNRVTSITNLGGDKELFGYNIAGNAISKTDGNNQAINYIYDALNRATQKSLPEGQTVIYTYDNWSNFISVKGNNNDVTYAYNLNNQQISETQILPGLAQNFNITRAYNAAQQLSSLTDAKGVTVGYEYDNRGLLSVVKNGAQNLATYSYTSFNKPQALTYSNGLVTNYDYDELHRTKKIEVLNGAVSLWKQEYNYDAENNRAQLTENGARVITYGYDNLDQITSVKYPDTSGSGEIKFDYDTWGNRKSLNSQLGTTNYTYAANSDELQNYKINNRMQVNLQYNNNGSLTQEVYQRLGKNIRTVDYSWDSQNRLQQITYQSTDRPAFMPTLPSNTMQFVYDDAGNRVKKTVNGKSTYYLNDGLRVLNEIDQTGAVDKTIVYGLEQVAEIKKDGTIQFIHADVLGSTVLITDQIGAVKQEYEYDVFGSIIGKNGLDETNYLFTNQEYDSESELYYYNARYYNPTIGRFISRDPVPGDDGDIISRNSYVYVKNNPLKYVDPSGEEEESLWSKFVNNDIVQGTAGFGVGFAKGAWSTVEFVGGLAYSGLKFQYDLITNPIETSKNVVNTLGEWGNTALDIGNSAWNYGKDFYNDPGKTLGNTAKGIGDWAGGVYNDFMSKSAYEKGEALGFGTEKIVEAVLISKGVGAVTKATGAIPAGLTECQFCTMSSMIKKGAGGLSDDIVVQGSRVKGSITATSDIDIGIRVGSQKFEQTASGIFTQEKYGAEYAAKLGNALDKGIIHSGPAGLNPLQNSVQQYLNMETDISIIKKGGLFDKGPFIPIK